MFQNLMQRCAPDHLSDTDKEAMNWACAGVLEVFPDTGLEYGHIDHVDYTGLAGSSVCQANLPIDSEYLCQF